MQNISPVQLPAGYQLTAPVDPAWATILTQPAIEFVNAAIRLEEIYRTVKKDPVRARELLVRARALFPDSLELAALDRSDPPS